MSNHSRATFLFAAIAAAVASSCAPDGAGDTSSVDQESRLDPTLGNGHGIGGSTQGVNRRRSNAMSIESRALIDINDTTSFEATTGELDSQIPPNGVIDTVMLKIFNADGHLLDVRHFQHVQETSFAFALQGLQRGQPFVLSARIVDANGHQLQVDAGDWVRLRPRVIIAGIISPDFSIGIISPDKPGIISPDYIWRNQHVAITALLREVNSDTSAHADCVLSVDSAVVATQPSVALAAGGNASCSFDTVFTQTGHHTVTVGLSNITPADYTGSAPSVSQSVTVIGN